MFVGRRTEWTGSLGPGSGGKLNLTVSTRKFFRIRYPVRERPRLRILAETFSVIDTSESGLLFLSSTLPRFNLDHEVSGQLIFQDGHRIKIRGKVVRRNKNQYAMALDDGIPLPNMMAEHLAILAKYPSNRARSSE